MAKRVAAVAVPVGLVVGGVAYGISRHSSKDEKTLGECTTHVSGLTVVLTDAQARNASLISAVSVRRGMPAHAATIGLATALQESKLYDLRGGDRDSLGLFQQRPSEGWGTRQQVLDPLYATNAFYDALEKVPGWETLAVTKAAQDVQHSGFPEAYASYEKDARALASALTGYSPAAFSCHLPAPAGRATPSVRRAESLRRALRPVFGPVSVSVGADGRLAVASGTVPRGWALASYLVAHAQTLHIGRVGYRERAWTAGSSHGWERASSGSATDSVVID
ncbi:MAG TPA: hypothetical protein VHW64_19635 [Nocardioides sp.]|jgi:hypothetical protein|uniref:hypothetical protein n=1 Tax=Nocardioides sp. TaxID=35761 RepID=UPI002E31170C|nr:hypothetical protein [Nocardioides sp.]HEX3932908.1 hypothetical protein [Nocardioides sp.]